MSKLYIAWIMNMATIGEKSQIPVYPKMFCIRFRAGANTGSVAAYVNCTIGFDGFGLIQGMMILIKIKILINRTK